MSVIDLAQGRWPSILAQHGLNRQELSGKHTVCPVCGGTDRFRFFDKNRSGKLVGKWVCSHCRPSTGDGMDLLQALTGETFSILAREIERIAGKIIPMTASKKKDQSPILNAIGKHCIPITDDPVSRYLLGRGLSVPDGEIRYHPEVMYYHERKATMTYPAMVGRIVDKHGNRESYHITYLTPEGSKADVEDPKKILTPLDTISGCYINVGKIGKTIVVAEGIETAIAASGLFGLPAVAAISAHGMETIDLPDSVEAVIIAGDKDDSFTGQAAAYALAKKLRNKGVYVKVFFPTNDGNDFADNIGAA